VEHLKYVLETGQKDQITELQNIIQQKDLENDQMKTIIYELNTQNKFFRKELGRKSELRSPEFQELKETTSECNQTESNTSHLESKIMEINELEMTNRYEELNLNLIENLALASPEIQPITPTEQNRMKKEKFETPIHINNSVNSFGEKQMELKDISNAKMNEEVGLETNEKKNFKKTPMKKIEKEKENFNMQSKTSTEGNDAMLESISSSVYEKIVNFYSGFYVEI